MNAGKPLRLFVAAPVPQWVGEQVASALPEARWTDVSTHLTLEFIGSTPRDKLGWPPQCVSPPKDRPLDDVTAAPTTVPAGRSAAPVSPTATGAYPNRRRRLIERRG